MSSIPEWFKDKIKESSDIVDVVGSYVPLKKSSSNFVGLCPFHNEKTASFSVNPEGQFYHCFGCHKGGDVISFIMEIEKLDFVDAVKFLADRAGLQVPESGSTKENSRKKYQDMVRRALLESARYFFRLLYSGDGRECQKYIEKRGISKSVLAQFGIGYSGNGGLYRHLKEKGFSDKTILATGLCRKKPDGRVTELFYRRMMFPIFSHRIKPEVVGFGGRVLTNELPKYINSPDSDIYHKGEILYGYNLARKSGSDYFLICEGYLDVMSCFQAGVDFAVAPLGTALTEGQAKEIKKRKNKVIVCFDSDSAGKAAAIRSFSILEKEGIDIFVLELPEAKDPDEFVKKNGAEAFRNLLSKDRLIPALDYKLKILEAENRAGGKIDERAYIKSLIPLLSDIESESLRSVYINRSAEKLGVNPLSLKTDIEKYSGSMRRKKLNKKSEVAGNGSFVSGSRQYNAAEEKFSANTDEKGQRGRTYLPSLTLLYLLLKHPKFKNKLPETLSPSLFYSLDGESFAIKLVNEFEDGSLDLRNIHDFFRDNSEAYAELSSDFTGIAAEADAGDAGGFSKSLNAEEAHITEDLIHNYRKVSLLTLLSERDMILELMKKEKDFPDKLEGLRSAFGSISEKIKKLKNEEEI